MKTNSTLNSNPCIIHIVGTFFNRISVNLSMFSVAFFMFLCVAYDVQGQSYELDFSDTATYRVSGGTVVPAKWSVKNDSCEMRTPYLVVEDEAIEEVTYSIRINQSGNGESTDKIYIYHAINEESWVLDTTITAAENSAVFTYNEAIPISSGNYLQLKVAMQTNKQTEFWALMDGDLDAANVVAYSSKPGTVPIKLLAFSGQQAKPGVMLNWSTAAESNNDYFSLERSYNGILFEPIATVEGSGNSNNTIIYTYMDEATLDASVTTVYYRLRQTDFDGHSEYVGFISCNITSDTELLSPVIIYSPADKAADIRISSDQELPVHVMVYDLNGNMLIDTEQHIVKGSNRLSLALGGAAKGIYVVYTEMNGQRFVRKINVL